MHGELSCGCYMHGEFELWVIACMVSLRCGWCIHGDFELWVVACMVSLSCGCYMHDKFEVWMAHGVSKLLWQLWVPHYTFLHVPVVIILFTFCNLCFMP